MNFKGPIVNIIEGDRVCIVEERYNRVSGHPEEGDDNDNVCINYGFLESRCLRNHCKEAPKEHEIVTELNDESGEAIGEEIDHDGIPNRSRIFPA